MTQLLRNSIILFITFLTLGTLFSNNIYSKKLDVESFGVTSLSKPKASKDSLISIESVSSSHYGVQSVTGNSILSVIDSSPFAEIAPLNVAPKLEGIALAYPNPMSLSAGGGNIGYKLSKNMEIEIRIYDMLSNTIFQQTYEEGVNGGKAGWNNPEFSVTQLNNIEVPVGVYIYLLLYEGNVISRGKIGVLR